MHDQDRRYARVWTSGFLIGIIAGLVMSGFLF